MNKNLLNRRQALAIMSLGLVATLTGCAGTPLALLKPVPRTDHREKGTTSNSSILAHINEQNSERQQNAKRPVNRAVIADVVKTAQSQLGTRYVLGGASPSSGFDCSGLIYWAYKQHNISIPRITKDQAYAGKGVSTNSLQPGDILVFEQSSAPNKLHTGLYVGNDQFIHSPNSKSKVRIDSVTSSYWQKSLLVARRVV